MCATSNEHAGVASFTGSNQKSNGVQAREQKMILFDPLRLKEIDNITKPLYSDAVRIILSII